MRKLTDSEVKLLGHWQSSLGLIRALTNDLDTDIATCGSTLSPQALNVVQVLSLLTPHNRAALSTANFTTRPASRLTRPRVASALGDRPRREFISIVCYSAGLCELHW